MLVHLKFKLISSISGKMQVLIHLILLVSRLLENLENFFNPLKALLKGQSINLKSKKLNWKMNAVRDCFVQHLEKIFRITSCMFFSLDCVFETSMSRTEMGKRAPHHNCHTQFEFNTEKECHWNSKQHTHCLSILPKFSNF